MKWGGNNGGNDNWEFIGREDGAVGENGVSDEKLSRQEGRSVAKLQSMWPGSVLYYLCALKD